MTLIGCELAPLQCFGLVWVLANTIRVAKRQNVLPTRLTSVLVRLLRELAHGSGFFEALFQ